MTRSFLFDMDGVLIDSENTWKKLQDRLLPPVLGDEIYDQVKDKFMGHPLAVNYQTVKDLGYSGTLEDLISVFHGCHDLVYESSPITPGVVELIDYLQERGFKLGVVSASAQDWIESVLEKLGRRDAFSCLVSLNKHPVLKTKPAPDGYLHAMETLGVTPDQTIILEDSQAGVTAAKRSGALTICFTGLHPSDYLVEGADIYLQSIASVGSFIQSRV